MNPRPYLLLLSLAGAACGPPDEAPAPPVLHDIHLTALDPGLLLPGSRLSVAGSNFVPDFGGPSELVLSGKLDGTAATVRLPLAFVDYDRMEASFPGGIEAGLDGDTGTLSGSATVEATSGLDGLRHLSKPMAIEIEVRTELSPTLAALQNEALFVNDPVVAHGEGFLLGGTEGDTVAVVEGCFAPEGSGECAPLVPTEIVAAPMATFDRTRVVFPFSPRIAGIEPGHFAGTVKLVNRHGPEAGHVELASQPLPTQNDIVEPAILAVSPTTASLGQYVDFVGGGFVGSPGGGGAEGVTTIELDGSFTPEGGSAMPASVTLVPRFVGGQQVRYVLDEGDELGQAVDLRTTAGTFGGTARPVTEYGGVTVTGSSTKVTLGVGHVKQVVWLRFLPAYRESLRKLGMRAAAERVRQRVLEVVRRDYAGVNVDFREDVPDDFALYAEVEIGGPDPNGVGLLGYDNTPGKDDGNLRLYDKIGGVNALTQLDGYPGYGGVFVESLFGFSLHPNGIAAQNDGADAAFDQLFDPFRTDVGGTPIGAGELGAPLASGDGCPAKDRPTRVACAIWALGSLIGTTVSHELAHSLGLADPGGSAFHNSGDFPDALMDAGDARSFRERAEILGQGPGRFCRHNYQYLQSILPTGEPDPLPSRVECY